MATSTTQLSALNPHKHQINHIRFFLKTCEQDFVDAYNRHGFRSAHPPEVLYAAWRATQYVITRGLTGDIVEFGVWTGGTLAIIAEALAKARAPNRLIGYDTFSGYPPPEESEMDVWGKSMRERYNEEIGRNGSWARADHQEVSNYLKKIYSNVVINKEVIDDKTDFDDISKIAILRSDLNWRHPTQVVLERNFSKLERGGVLFVVSEHHSGAKDAFETYFRHTLNLFFQRVNYSTVCAVIPD